MFRSPFVWLAELLAGSPFSEYLQARFWIIPTLQVFHILALAAVMASVWILYLRLIGVAGRAHTITAMAQRFLPWIWGALIVLAISGGLLVAAEPFDSLLKPMMQIKVVLLVVAIALTIVFQRGVARKAYPESAAAAPQASTKILGAISLLVWVSIAVAGRLIAYV